MYHLENDGTSNVILAVYPALLGMYHLENDGTSNKK